MNTRASTSSVIDDLTVLIPVRDDVRIERCVDSIDAACRVLIAANGATGEFVDWLRLIAPQAEIVTTPEPGLGRAYNLGLERCRTEFALLMDSDCVFTSGCIARIREGLQGAPLSKGRVIFSHDSFGSRLTAGYRTMHTSGFVNAYSPPLGLSRTVVRQLLGGYFHEELQWAEDYEFDVRVRSRGLRISYDPDATVIHPPVGMADDVRAAYRYGTGHGMAERLQFLPPARKQPLLGLLRAEARHLRRVAADGGALCAAYAFVWHVAFRCGHRAVTRAA